MTCQVVRLMTMVSNLVSPPSRVGYSGSKWAKMAYTWGLITNHLVTGMILQGNLQDWWMLLWFRKFPSGHPYGVARKGCGAHGYLYSARGNVQGWVSSEM